jgi:hypothetical protein
LISYIACGVTRVLQSIVMGVESTGGSAVFVGSGVGVAEGAEALGDFVGLAAVSVAHPETPPARVAATTRARRARDAEAGIPTFSRTTTVECASDGRR